MFGPEPMRFFGSGDSIPGPANDLPKLSWAGAGAGADAEPSDNSSASSQSKMGRARNL